MKAAAAVAPNGELAPMQRCSDACVRVCVCVMWPFATALAWFEHPSRRRRPSPVSRLPSPVTHLPSPVSHLPPPISRLPSPVTHLPSPTPHLSSTLPAASLPLPAAFCAHSPLRTETPVRPHVGRLFVGVTGDAMLKDKSLKELIEPAGGE